MGYKPSFYSVQHPIKYRGADKSLARPGRKQATATKFQLLQATQKKKKIRRLSVQPSLRGSNELSVGRKMATFQLFFQHPCTRYTI